MDFKQLQSFAAVVECRSFTKAAEQLFVSQPTVSAHIRALEEELKTPLIIRTTKCIEVTENGRRVYDDAISILRIRERMVETCSADHKRILRVAASTIPAAYMLPEILPEFGRRCPQTYFSIHQNENRGVLDGVAEGRFDLGFATMRGDEQLMSLPVCQDRMILITPVSQHFLQLHGQKALSAESLFSHPMILREKTEAGQKIADRYLAALGVEEQTLQVVARANDQETVKNLVAAGMGISLISQRAARNFIDEKRVLSFELPVQSEKTIYLVCRKADWQIEHIQHFARFVQQKYAHE
ncbi:MAG: LysR family transcriptional regulator [Clostridia bacterium]|nr:LysR family transcriptional regulator [Clostridia bacterium]